MTVSHEETTEAEPGSKPPPVIEATAVPDPEGPKAKGKGIRGWLRRFRGSDA
jgi:hypothetical protein